MDRLKQINKKLDKISKARDKAMKSFDFQESSYEDFEALHEPFTDEACPLLHERQQLTAIPMSRECPTSLFHLLM